ncbi:MAG: AmmeMemoRadiSam system radical SAM enzyme [Gemmatimonadota bacterium]|nr:MAG: AmmeMemoRadiSam system radical SAM enzyme [Gemmatimonadota bacterium]
MATTLVELLDARTRAGSLYERLDEAGNVRCFACGLRCLIRPGRRGVCRVRFNRDGTLMVPFDYVAALQCDPVEKKPLFHMLPGARALTFGMLGCDLHCDYCQNWITSQALRDEAAGIGPRDVSADSIVELAVRRGARIIASSYNEPLITAEWAVEVFRHAKERGIRTAFISNGNATPAALNYLGPWLDAFRIDLKTMSDRSYRKLGGVLHHVLETVRLAYERAFWVEIVTLLVPGFNDSDDELRDAAGFIASVSTEIPWHVTAFKPDYRMSERANTRAQDLIRAAEIGREAGLPYVYAGNLPGMVGGLEDTCCPVCGQALIERHGYHVRSDEVSRNDGLCPACGARIAGIWESAGATIRL